MKDSLFIIAIGGTGMRCLEAFVHLCAVGMFDNEEINILTLDTDQSNGNKGRVERLIELYNKVKTDNPESPGGSPNSNTFFSSKLNLYRFYTDYSMANRITYSKLSATQGVAQETEEDDHDLADLFLEHDTVQSFNLEHGYRAQTHLGSMLMYHGIVEAACHYVANKAKATEPELQLADFLTELQKSGTGARVFVFGSVATEKKVLVGKVMKYFSKLGVAEVAVEASTFDKGEKLLITGNTTGVMYLNADEIRYDLKPVETAQQGWRVSVPVPGKVRPNDKLYKLITVNEIKEIK